MEDQDLPTRLPNPQALTFSGGASGRYDGSQPMTVQIPQKLPSPQALTFSGGATGGYDGSTAKSVAIPYIQSGTLTIKNDRAYKDMYYASVKFPVVFKSVPMISVACSDNSPCLFSVTFVGGDLFWMAASLDSGAQANFTWWAIGV